MTCAFIVRRQSNVRPKFFTDCLKGIWALPMVIEVGRLWRCLVLLEVTCMSSVLLSLRSTHLGHTIYYLQLFYNNSLLKYLSTDI